MKENLPVSEQRSDLFRGMGSYEDFRRKLEHERKQEFQEFLTQQKASYLENELNSPRRLRSSVEGPDQYRNSNNMIPIVPGINDYRSSRESKSFNYDDLLKTQLERERDYRRTHLGEDVYYQPVTTTTRSFSQPTAYDTSLQNLTSRSRNVGRISSYSDGRHDGSSLVRAYQPAILSYSDNRSDLRKSIDKQLAEISENRRRTTSERMASLQSNHDIVMSSRSDATGILDNGFGDIYYQPPRPPVSTQLPAISSTTPSSYSIFPAQSDNTSVPYLPPAVPIQQSK